MPTPALGICETNAQVENEMRNKINGSQHNFGLHQPVDRHQITDIKNNIDVCTNQLYDGDVPLPPKIRPSPLS